MATQSNDPSVDPRTGAVPWWQGPPPAGWTGAWPPPLEAGDTYGPEVGQVNYTPEHAAARYGTMPPPPTNTPTNTPTPHPTPTGDPTGGTGGLVNAYQDPFAAPPPTSFPSAPQFHAPTGEEALNDPGYQFRLQQGHDQLQHWAASRGTLNDSSTAKALEDYGQNSASQEYQQVFNRNWNAFQPQLLSYTTDTARIQHTNDLEWQHANDLWMQKYNMFRNRQLDTVNANTATA